MGIPADGSDIRNLTYLLGHDGTGLFGRRATGNVLRPFKPSIADVIGDSRTNDVTTANLSLTRQVGLTGSSWLNWANALAGQRLRIGTNFSVGGRRTDEYIAANLQGMIDSPSGIAIFGYPCVNNLVPNAGGSASSFPYTHTDGRSIPLSEAGQVAFEDIREAALALVAAGKLVIVTCEPGATNLSAGRIQQLHDFNTRLISWAEETPGVICWSANPALWLPTGSATQVVMRPGFLQTGDVSHYSILGAYSAGRVFADVLRTLFAPADLAIASINDNYGQNPRQLIRNALFNATSGGTRTTVAGTGSVPSGWTVSGAATSTVNITHTPDAQGFGNAVTFEISGTASNIVTIGSNAPANADWSLDDVFEMGFDVDVAAGAHSAHVYGNLQVNTGAAGSADWWSLWGNVAMGAGPSEAYSVRHKTQRATVIPGSTAKGYLAPQILARLIGGEAAITFTIRRAYLLKRL